MYCVYCKIDIEINKTGDPREFLGKLLDTMKNLKDILGFKDTCEGKTVWAIFNLTFDIQHLSKYIIKSEKW